MKRSDLSAEPVRACVRGWLALVRGLAEGLSAGRFGRLFCGRNFLLLLHSEGRRKSVSEAKFNSERRAGAWKGKFCKDERARGYIAEVRVSQMRTVERLLPELVIVGVCMRSARFESLFDCWWSVSVSDVPVISWYLGGVPFPCCFPPAFVWICIARSPFSA